MEGYDVNGLLVTRSTSDALAIGESVTLRLHDPEGRIRSVRAFGTAGTSVSLDDFRYGPEISATSSLFGTFSFSGLPDGTYAMEIQSPSSQYLIADEELTVQVVNGVADPIVIRAVRATSPWTNPNNPLDVNARDGVQPLDALIIINELNRSSPRLLTDQDSTPPYLDVNGDWSVTPIDALRIINHLNRGGVDLGSGEGPSDLRSDSGTPPGSGGGASGTFAGGADFFGGGAGIGEGESIEPRELSGGIDGEAADYLFARSAWNSSDHHLTALGSDNVHGSQRRVDSALLRTSGSSGVGYFRYQEGLLDVFYPFYVFCQL